MKDIREWANQILLLKDFYILNLVTDQYLALVADCYYDTEKQLIWLYILFAQESFVDQKISEEWFSSENVGKESEGISINNEYHHQM